MPDVVEGWTTSRLWAEYPKLRSVRYADHVIPASTGGVRARTYRTPDGRAADTLVWVHGGAFVVGHLDMPESHWVAMSLAAQGIDVIALEYTKCLHGVTFPGPSDDVLTGWRWALREQATAGPATRMHLGGASAGANLVAGVAKRLLVEAAELPHQLLLAYPMVSPRLWPTQPTAHEDVLQAHRAIRLAQHYAGSAGIDHPVAFAANGPVHPHHPTTRFLLADADDLRPSAEHYARTLGAVGVTTEVCTVTGSTHGFLNRPGTSHGERGVSTLRRWVTGAV